jgi:hypothetical protein
MFEFLRSISPKPETLWVGFCAICPVLAIFVIDELQRRKRVGYKSPVKGKLLRPAGYTCLRRLDEAEHSFIKLILISAGVCSAAGIMTIITLAYIKARGFVYLAWIPGLSTVAFAVLGWKCVAQAVKTINDGRNFRLGLRGEQAVAEVLNDLRECGFRIYHDLLRPDKKLNIDHIAVGPQGVFVIETKAKTMRRPRKDHPGHVVHVDGTILRFSFGYDADAIPQAKDNADWLSDHLSKKTAEAVEARPIVVLPGAWWVERVSKPDPDVAVMNTNALAEHLRRKTNKLLQPAQVDRIIAELDEKCRDVEF